MSASYKSVTEWLAAAEKRVHELEEAIRKHESQYLSGDPNDLCWENDFELYKALYYGKSSLVKMPEMITEDEFLGNCKKFYCSRLKGLDKCPTK